MKTSEAMNKAKLSAFVQHSSNDLLELFTPDEQKDIFNWMLHNLKAHRETIKKLEIENLKLRLRKKKI